MRGSWRPNWTATYWPPLLWPSVFLLGCSTWGLGAQPLWDMFLNPASSLQLTDFLSSPGLYNCSTPTFFLWASQITLNQPVHGQGYILIFLDRMHLLFTQVHFLFWQPEQGRKSIYNSWFGHALWFLYLYKRTTTLSKQSLL